MVRDGLVFKDEDGQVIFNQYSFCELVKYLMVELVGISYEEASQSDLVRHNICIDIGYNHNVCSGRCGGSYCR